MEMWDWNNAPASSSNVKVTNSIISPKFYFAPCSEAYDIFFSVMKTRIIFEIWLLILWYPRDIYLHEICSNICMSLNLRFTRACFKIPSAYWPLQICFYNPLEHLRRIFLREENLRSQSCENKSQVARNHMHTLYKF